jgi:predicted 2-oxoglutarate/Fe(II)-dependent dioxygenase YbiX
VTNDFDKNGYVHLKDFLDKDNCNELINVIQDLVDQGKTIKGDRQCPLSDSIHGNSTFDKLLEDLLPNFEEACGKRLYPTYSYARLYKPGEELKKHTDRPACEISATITLGFDGDVWSIYMAGNKVDMQVGDAVLYRGMEVEHWREKYTEGQWQAQVFLHYVDADGPHADQKYDGRNSLGIPKQGNEIVELPNCVHYSNHMSSKFCNMIINRYIKNDIEKKPPLIGVGEGNLNKKVRDTERVVLPLNAGIAATLTTTALNTNQERWQYNITHSNQSEFLIYKPEGHYTAHVDTFHTHGEVRKLTALAFLNDDYEGGRFFLNPDGNVYYPPQEKGSVLVFPSYMVHGVEPVTKGVRYSCVTWLVGPYFK